MCLRRTQIQFLYKMSQYSDLWLTFNHRRSTVQVYILHSYTLRCKLGIWIRNIYPVDPDYFKTDQKENVKMENLSTTPLII